MGAAKHGMDRAELFSRPSFATPVFECDQLNGRDYSDSAAQQSDVGCNPPVTHQDTSASARSTKVQSTPTEESPAAGIDIYLQDNSADAQRQQNGHLIRADAVFPGPCIGIHSVQNTRPYQEDYTAMAEFDGVDGGARTIGMLMADGHGGSSTAAFVQDHLLKAVHQSMIEEGKPVQDALQQAFAITNQKLKETQGLVWHGSTATVVVTDGHSIICANCGDSPAFVVSRSGLATRLTVDDNTGTESERLRVQAEGGCVERRWLRAGGGRASYEVVLCRQGAGSNKALCVTRSFGDFNYPGVICNPHVLTMQLEEDAWYLVLASDGLTEQWSVGEAAKAVQQMACEGHSPAELARLLTERAVQKGSSDNISVIILDLHMFLQPSATDSATNSATTPPPDSATTTATTETASADALTSAADAATATSQPKPVHQQEDKHGK